MKILGLDPGGTTGWALLEDSRVLRMGEWKEKVFKDKLIAFLRDSPVDVIVCEDFVFRPGFKEGKWKTAEVPKMIGVVELAAQMFECKFIVQAPSIKPVGYGMAGLKYTKGKAGMHMYDAAAHATYYYRTKGVKLGKSS